MHWFRRLLQRPFGAALFSAVLFAALLLLVDYVREGTVDLIKAMIMGWVFFVVVWGFEILRAGPRS